MSKKSANKTVSTFTDIAELYAEETADQEY